MRVHSLSMGLARAYLIEYEDGLVLVDAGSPRAERVVLKRMQALGRFDLQLIFITHAHLDHYGSAAALRGISGAPIAIHRADEATMAQGGTSLGSVRGRGRLVSAFYPLINHLIKPEATPPDILVNDGDSLGLPGLQATVLHTPGHTPGSSCLLVADRLAFVGDLLSSTGHPHVQAYFAHDWSLIPNSLARLKNRHPEKVFPGHGRQPIDRKTLLNLSAETPFQ